ncbi:hypothetical protein HGRIS_002893 [Hohenbuehelia grisea]|uniref:DUF6589 domain-containing protein n=1 Tax=Hohenbuehelia grisea TaxID=104357 RepID=A0ABR3JN20_9AGAR
MSSNNSLPSGSSNLGAAFQFTPAIQPSPTPSYADFWIQHSRSPSPTVSRGPSLEPFRQQTLPLHPVFPQQFSTSSSTPQTPQPLGTRQHTRSYFGSENQPVSSDSPEMPKRPYPFGSGNSRSKRRKSSLSNTQNFRILTIAEKLDCVFDLLDSLDWTLGALMHFLFAWRSADSNKGSYSQRHGCFVQRYLSGTTTHGVAEILDAWYTSPLEIRSARSAVSSFAAQLVQGYLLDEAKNAVKGKSGLHAPLKKRRTADAVQWNDLGSSLMPTIKAKFQEHQPLMFAYMLSVAQGKPQKLRKDGTAPSEKYRPITYTVIHALAALDFCRSKEARLVPVARGVLYLSSAVPAEVITYNSRIGNMPSLNTIKATLKAFSDEKAASIQSDGRDTTVWMDDTTGKELTYVTTVFFDNIQGYHKQQHHRVGRTNNMVTGIACTARRIKASPRACDPAEKKKMLELNKREELTVDKLIKTIDQRHLKDVAILQFIGALTKYIPELSHLQEEVSLRYRTRCKKLRIPVEKDDIRPLATSSKNEAIISELKDGLLDFLDQLGQRENDYDARIWLGGGDGLSFQNMHTLKKHLQAHQDPHQSLALMEPILLWWHTMWTNLCRLLATHWGDALDDNPATVGHSAKKIGRQPPPNFKKVDYYPFMELLDLVHDMRMLDCWRIRFGVDNLFEHFAKLQSQKLTPSFEELESIAKELFKAYSTASAQAQAASDAHDETSPWASAIPQGSQWVAPNEGPVNPASVRPSKPKKKGQVSPLVSPNGDQTLSQSIAFMRDASIAREVAYAVAEGDAGRAWEGIKVMALTFAGSNHAKYTQYLLESICQIEFESNDDLKDLILRSELVNLTGNPGDFQPADIVQEGLNRCFEPLIQRKDTEFGSDHVRNVWSRNIKDIYELKEEFRKGLGLAKRSGKHRKPHEKTEVRILLEEYCERELHMRRPGRAIGNPRHVDDMERGIESLQNGGLRKWVARTTRSRGLRKDCNGTGAEDEGGAVNEEDEGEKSDGDESDDSVDDSDLVMTAAKAHARGGCLEYEFDDDLMDEMDSEGDNAN